MSEQRSAHSAPAMLDMLSLGPASVDRWSDEDLAAMLTHQLDCPLSAYLSADEVSPFRRQAAPAKREEPRMNSLSDLLAFPDPPPRLFELIKQYAQKARHGREGDLPAEVANVLYYVAIAGALVRLERRMTSLSNRDLRQGIDQLLKRSWLDERVRALLGEARTRLDAGAAEG